jgi:hypothetical protein
MLEFGLLEKRAITSTMLEKVRSEELAGECDPTGDRHQVSILQCTVVHGSFHMLLEYVKMQVNKKNCF